jgi:ankyrin repeat protein
VLDGPNKTRMQQSIEYLIKNGANVNAESNNTSILQSVLFLSFYYIWIPSEPLFKESMLKLLIKNGVKIGTGKYSAWNYVMEPQDVELLQQVDSSDLNHVDEEGKTKLHRILEGRCNDKDKVLTYLLQLGAEVAPGEDIFALVRKHCHKFSTIESLLEKHPGYDINTKDSRGRTLLFEYGHNNEDLKKILALGGDPNVTSNDGYTPLGINEVEECIKTLIEAGADPLDFTTPGKSVMRNILESCSYEFSFSESSTTFEYLLNLPQIKKSTSEKKK